ncbi:Nif3-like dinuclear metal center hexameric protein [Nocardioides limicola]|uniref:Nif3-like dinuclear metal center hexameric protein n=1 Tax=Nocardioides limicola TaxID=2803368 RepID=UPI00193B7ADD|nr:Nif3-like dinuclear metal center hexameric protein [Nocardioides sp. DJM-14]
MKLADVIALVHQWYPPATAEDWDAVGLVSGDPDAEVRRILLAVDPAPAVADEAAAWRADLLLVHHPLLLKPVHSIAPVTPKGRTLSTLLRADCALLTAHTNADKAAGGVSEAMASALGLTDLVPIVAEDDTALDKIVVFVPEGHAEKVRVAIAEAGAGRIGDYDQCSFTASGEGRFRPLPGADPAIGQIGRAEVVAEVRVEAVMPRHRRDAVVAAMRAAHPYEEPAHDVIELAGSRAATGTTGTGRIGSVSEQTLAEFADRVAAALPATASGVRVAGDPDRPVRRVAVCGGAGDFLLPSLADADVDVYVTSDLRHHVASEFVEQGGPALIDVAHWAAESTWLPVVQSLLREALGDTVDTRISTVRTDPWQFVSRGDL